MGSETVLKAVCTSNGCQRVRNHHTPSGRMKFVWDVYLLQEAGYPFKPNDFTFAEWKMIGEFRMLRRELEGKTNG